MGIDITAYGKATKLDCVFDEDGEPIDPVTRECLDYDTRVYVNPDFPGRAEGVEDRGVYKTEDSAEMLDMSYGRYNRWRDTLAKIAGWPLGEYEQYGRKYPSYAASAWDAKEGPFWELVLFSDCDGTIGPVVSAKLAKDFADFDDHAKAEGEDFYRPYQMMRAGFEMAANGGFVKFH